MEMQQIRYFLALAQTLNFTRAAEVCNVSQPALTRAIQGLEAELGGDLIRRERGNSHLTPLGQRMLPLMQQCYDAAESAQRMARAVKSSDIAPLALGFSSTVNLAKFVPSIAELFRAYPGAQLKIRRTGAAAILDMLKAGEIELAVAGPLPGNWERLDSWPIFMERMELAVHEDHRLSRTNSVEISQLAGERFLDIEGDEMAETLQAYLRDNGATGMTTHQVQSAHDLIALLEANAGISIVPESAPMSAVLARLPLQGSKLMRQVSAYAAAGRQRPVIASMFLNLLRSADWNEAQAA